MPYDVYANKCATTVASGGYTAGSGVLNVASTASPWPQITTGQQFRVSIFDQSTNALTVILLVTAINSGTQFAVTAEGTDANANHLDVVQGCLTAGAMDNIRAVDVLSPDKIRFGGVRDYAVGKQYTLVHSTSNTLLNYASGPGYLDNMWIGIEAPGGGHSGDFWIKITIDGTVIFNDAIGSWFCATYWSDTAAVAFGNDWVTQWGGLGSFIPIPFASSCKVELFNNGSSDRYIWWQLGFQTGAPNTWLRSAQIHTAVNSADSDGGLALTQDQVGTLVDVTGLNPGRLLGVYMCPDGYACNNNTFLEGALNIYTDGSLVFQTSGTEDFMFMSGYFGGVSAGYGNGQMTLTIKRSSPPLYAFCRFFIRDPILFENALKITWQAGNSTYATFTGAVHLGFTIFYYTE